MEPEKEECFVTPITTLDPLVVEYLVMDSMGEHERFVDPGELGISLRVTTSQKVLHSDNKTTRQEGDIKHVFHPEAIGNYKTCFYSYLNTKTVYPTVYITR